MEATHTPSTAPSSCFTCQKPQAEVAHALKRCAKCQTTLYCSRKCQKDDWKKHKRICSSQASSLLGSVPASIPPPQSSRGQQQHNPGFHAVNNLLGLSHDNHLHALPEQQAFAQLIDCFRMRVEDEYSFGGNHIGLYAQEDPVPEFRKFLDLAESRPRLLPPWWNAGKRRMCERLAVDSNEWSDINCAVEKADIQDHYNDSLMPMKLRVLGEKVYGKGFM